MDVKFFKAGCGDAIHIRYYGNDGKFHNIFIDAGYDRFYRETLCTEIDTLQKSNEKIDLWVLSHIHDDHVGGATMYIDAIKTNHAVDIVDKWYFNSPRCPKSTIELNSGVSEAKSISDGDDIVNYLLSRNKIPEDILDTSPEYNHYGLKFIFLSPDKQMLGKLREKYPQESFNRYEKNETSEISFATKKPEYDYNTTLDKFNLDTWKEDDSIENGSSISFLMIHNNIKILCLADSHPSIICNSLSKLGFSEKNKLKCDIVKISHHASKGNSNDRLFSIIDCDKYIISADAENRYCLPNKEVISRLLRNRHRNLKNKYNIYFTHDNKRLRSIFQNDNDTIYDKYNFETIFLSDIENHISFKF